MNNLEITHLEKNYPDFSLKDINIKLPKGKIIGFIGENGSGKTTTIKAILNLINIDKGNINVLGKKHNSLTNADKQEIGVVLDDSFFCNMYKIKDLNKLMKRFYLKWDEKLFWQYIKEFKLPQDKMLVELSSGMKMKIKVICAICHHPKLLILDEPTNSLDPVFRYDILNIFEKFVANKENSIFISSHITSDLEHIADEIIFINDGQILLDMPKDKLREKYKIVTCTKDLFSHFAKDYYCKYLKYKDEYLLLIDNIEKFKKKYPKVNFKDATLEELMLMLVKGE